jgi:predicted nucleic acid-binding Zn ribbon protein
MPTYEFRCPDGTIIERVFKMSDVPESIPAPDGSGTAVRIISGGADLIFKGSGFYITDYGKDGKKEQRERSAKTEDKSPERKEGAATESSGAKAESSSDATSESKSAPKAPPSGEAKGESKSASSPDKPGKPPSGAAA